MDGARQQQHQQHQQQQQHPPPPPPPPPRHGANGSSTEGGPGAELPPGNYDIFVIPPHSAGSGFLYLPSLKPQRNSFLAGSACTLVAVGVWSVIVPVLRGWLATVFASGGAGVIFLVAGVGVAGWAWGKTQSEMAGGGSANAGARAGAGAGPGAGGGTSGGGGAGGGGDGAGGGAYAHGQTGPNDGHASGPSPQRAGHDGGAGPAGAGAGPRPAATAAPGQTPFGTRAGAGQPQSRPASGWEKAREETRKREEERKRQDELKRKKDEAEKQARAAAEKEKWERMRSREKEASEREAREARDTAARETAAREKAAAAAAAATAAASKTSESRPQRNASSFDKRYEKPSAQTYVGSEEDMYSFRPYDKPKAAGGSAHKASSHSSIYSDGSSYAASQSTARTTPPPSHRGPYTTKDPDKVVIRAVYLFTDLFPKPIAQLISGVGNVTDGLTLRITTEGLFIDDDVRGVPQREWDIKAWTLKSVDTGDWAGQHILRASIRDADGKRYVVVIADDEVAKVAVGLQRLRKGSQVRALAVNPIPATETKSLLTSLGWGSNARP